MESIETFMRRCLHHPKNGYYAKNITAVGSRGDFTTMPQLSTAPARAIARWALEAMKKHRTPNLIEIGPGMGLLSKNILAALPAFQRFRTKLHLVDSSLPLQAKQKELLGKKATYHSTVASALKACDGRAIIFSNELIDAFPARLFEKSASGWMEIFIEKRDGKIHEIRQKPESLPLSSALKKDYPFKQRVEVHDAYRQWQEKWLPEWYAGEILTIDYGAEVADLYHRRPSGTLRAYLLQQRIDGPGIYLNQGQQDLTADVNFTDLQLWTEGQLTNCQLLPFSKFIQNHQTEDPKISDAAKHFQCLTQTREL